MHPRTFGPLGPATTPAPLDRPPEAHAEDQTLAANKVVLLSSILTGSDPEGAPLSYLIIDRTADPDGSYLTLDGHVFAAGQLITLNAEEYARAEVHVGASGSVDHFFAAVSDGVNQSVRVDFTLTAHNTLPVLQANSLTLLRNVTVNAKDIFKASDADGDALTIVVRDENGAAGSGHWIFKGAELSAGHDHTVASSELGQLAWRSASLKTGVQDQVTISVSDGSASVGPVTVTLTTVKNQEPTVTVEDQQVEAGEPISVLPWIKFTDPDGDLPERFAFEDKTPGGGHFVLDGQSQENVPFFSVHIDNMDKLYWVPGEPGSDDYIEVRGYDHFDWSPWDGFHVTTTAPATAQDLLTL